MKSGPGLTGGPAPAVVAGHGGGDAPVLSVITASRGRHELLRRKALALAAQSLPPRDFEWCLWLNESSADLVLLRELLEGLSLPFAVALLGGEAHPVGKARNLAAEAAQGEVLLLSDDDCLPDRRALEAHLELHRREAGVAGIGGLRLPERLRKGKRSEPFERVVSLGLRRAAWINFTGANSSLAAQVFWSAGGYDSAWSGYGGEDPELALRLRRQGTRFRRVPDGGAVHEGRVWDDAEKAYSAGQAHWAVCQRHGTGSWALGVHPWQLVAKRFLLHGPVGSLFDPAVLSYERAYAQGAADAARSGSVRGGVDEPGTPGGRLHRKVARAASESDPNPTKRSRAGEKRRKESGNDL